MTLHRIGLTGGIGSGKTTAAAMFADLGVPILDLDQVGHSITQAGSTGLRQLADAFGADIIQPDGSLNRKRLAQHCFSDAGRTQQLNAILHPLIWQAEETWLQQQQGDFAIIEASVLLESGGIQRMDAIIVVLADLELRRQRTMARNHCSSSQFEAIIQRQCSDKERRHAADFSLINNTDIAHLQQQVITVYHALQQRFHTAVTVPNRNK